MSTWKRLFLEGVRAGLEAGGKPGPNSREQQLLDELEEVSLQCLMGSWTPLVTLSH